MTTDLSDIPQVLKRFTDEERKLIAALPYRAGLWVSLSDQEGGNEAHESELRALESLIAGYSEDFCKSPLVEEIIHLTITHKGEWPSWKKDIEAVPGECRQAINLLAGEVDAKDISSFKHTIMEIAHTVAMAHREMGDKISLSDRLWIYGRFWLARLRAAIGRTKAPDFIDMLNISRAEQTVLNALAEALRIERGALP